MNVVAKIINPGLGLFSNHDVFISRDDIFDDIFLAKAAKADLIFVKTLADYALVKDLPVIKAFHIVTDDPNASCWGQMDEIYNDYLVRGILASSEQVLWHWRVPTSKAYIFPKCCSFDKTHDWSPILPRFVVFLNEAKARSWHVGADVLEEVGLSVPITVVGDKSDELQNVEALPKIDHRDVSKVASQYVGALMPYRYSASPNWMVEAMLQGMPIVSADFDYARIHIPDCIRYTVPDLVEKMKLVLENPIVHCSHEQRALYTFDRARAKRQVDAVFNQLV